MAICFSCFLLWSSFPYISISQSLLVTIDFPYSYFSLQRLGLFRPGPSCCHSMSYQTISWDWPFCRPYQPRQSSHPSSQSRLPIPPASDSTRDFDWDVSQATTLILFGACCLFYLCKSTYSRTATSSSPSSAAWKSRVKSTGLHQCWAHLDNRSWWILPRCQHPCHCRSWSPLTSDNSCPCASSGGSWTYFVLVRLLNAPPGSSSFSVSFPSRSLLRRRRGVASLLRERAAVGWKSPLLGSFEEGAGSWSAVKLHLLWSQQLQRQRSRWQHLLQSLIPCASTSCSLVPQLGNSNYVSDSSVYWLPSAAQPAVTKVRRSISGPYTLHSSPNPLWQQQLAALPALGRKYEQALSVSSWHDSIIISTQSSCPSARANHYKIEAGTPFAALFPYSCLWQTSGQVRDPGSRRRGAGCSGARCPSLAVHRLVMRQGCPLSVCRCWDRWMLSARSCPWSSWPDFFFLTYAWARSLPMIPRAARRSWICRWTSYFDVRSAWIHYVFPGCSRPWTGAWASWDHVLVLVSWFRQSWGLYRVSSSIFISSSYWLSAATLSNPSCQSQVGTNYSAAACLPSLTSASCSWLGSHCCWWKCRFRSFWICTGTVRHWMFLCNTYRWRVGLSCCCSLPIFFMTPSYSSISQRDSSWKCRL